MIAMPFTERYQVTPRYLDVPSRRRSQLPMSPGVRFIVCHDTANPGSTAAQNVRYFNSTPNPKHVSSAHIFVDDKEIIECIPALTGNPEKAWHVLYDRPNDNLIFGLDSNDAAIGVEYCYGPKIDADAAYAKYVWVVAFACWKFGLDPRTQITGHCFIDPPPNKSDPVEGLGFSRRTYEQLLRDIVTEYETCAGVQLPLLTGPIGQVRVTMKLNVRKGEPHQRAPVQQVVNPGTLLQSVDFTNAGDPVNGNPVWCKDAAGNYFWSGAVIPSSIQPPVQPAPQPPGGPTGDAAYYAASAMRVVAFHAAVPLPALTTPDGYSPPKSSAPVLQSIPFSRAIRVGQAYSDRFDRWDALELKKESSDPNRCRGLYKLPGDVLFWESKMAIDADGSTTPSVLQSSGGSNSHTSLHFADTKSTAVDAEVVPYFVIPTYDDPAKVGSGQPYEGSMDSFVKDFGLRHGNLGVIVYGDRMVGAIFADEGPAMKIGEASIRVHEKLRDPPAPWQGDPADKVLHDVGPEAGVLYFVFVDTVFDINQFSPNQQDKLAVAIQKAALARFEALKKS
jgi:N-acetylmuramoyl-L-alanine amidase